MNFELGIAGLICAVLAIGHTTVGAVWVLPNLTKERLPSTPFGPSSMTVAMVRVTWYIVTIFVLALGALLMILAWAEDADPKTVLLRSFAVMWLVATVMAVGISGFGVRKLRYLLRLPVPLFFLVVAVLCWTAST